MDYIVESGDVIPSNNYEHFGRTVSEEIVIDIPINNNIKETNLNQYVPYFKEINTILVPDDSSDEDELKIPKLKKKEKKVLNFLCDSCARCFRDEKKLLAHKKLSQIECEICNKKFCKRVLLKNHLRLHFMQSKDCEICSKPVKLCYYDIHVRQHEKIKTRKPKKNPKTKTKKN